MSHKLSYDTIGAHRPGAWLAMTGLDSKVGTFARTRDATEEDSSRANVPDASKFEESLCCNASNPATSQIVQLLMRLALGLRLKRYAALTAGFQRYDSRTFMKNSSISC